MGVGWTLATAFTTTRFGAIAALPIWTLVGYLSLGLRHFGRVAVVDVHRRRRAPIDLRRVMTLMLAWLAGTVALSAASALAGQPLSPWWHLVPLLVTLPGAAVVMGRELRSGGRFGDPPGDWVITMLAGRAGSHALPIAARLIERVVPPGASIGVRAADAHRARLFELRYGFRVPDPARRLELIRDAPDR